MKVVVGSLAAIAAAGVFAAEPAEDGRVRVFMQPNSFVLVEW